MACALIRLEKTVRTYLNMFAYLTNEMRKKMVAFMQSHISTAFAEFF